MYLIKIKTNNGHECWWKSLAEGDPGRTRKKENATQFAKKSNCESKIESLKEKYPNREYSIEEV